MANAQNHLTFPAIDPIDIRFYRLIWQPAAHMHKTWWEKLALSSWRSIYSYTPNCRRSIDHAIVIRRDFPHRDIHYDLNLQERQLIDISSKVPSLCLALGWLCLARPEYWMLKPYRVMLQNALSDLGELAYRQLSVFTTLASPPGFRICSPFLEPEELAQAAQTRGMTLLNAALPASVALRAIEILLPPASSEIPELDTTRLIDKNVATFALDTFFRLARFL